MEFVNMECPQCNNQVSILTPIDGFELCYDCLKLFNGRSKRIKQFPSLREKIMKEIAMERDNFNCQKCNKKFLKQDLEVHHKKHLSQGGNHNLLNLITLCIEHHKEEHKIRALNKPKHL